MGKGGRREYQNENGNGEIAVENILEIKNKILALIILPTRELAMQVKTILLKLYCCTLPLKVNTKNSRHIYVLTC